MNNIVYKYEILNSFELDKYFRFKELLEKSIESNLMDEERASLISLEMFSECISMARNYREEIEYINNSEFEQLVENYLKIVGFYLSSFKNSEALEMLSNTKSAIILKDALLFYNEKNLEAYNYLKQSLDVFEKIKCREAVSLIKRTMSMYKYFSSKIADFDIALISVNSDIVLFENYSLTTEELMYSDIKRYSLAGGFVNYLNASKTLFYEAQILSAFEPQSINKLLLLAQKEVYILNVGILKIPISNITSIVLNQFIFSNFYHKNLEEPLTLNMNEAKIALWEILNGLVDEIELFENLESNILYLQFDKETRELINEQKLKMKNEIKLLLEKHESNLSVVVNGKD